MKCPGCGDRLMASAFGRVVCANGCRVLKPKRLGETVYWKPGFRDSLNRVTVSVISHRSGGVE